MKLFEALKTLFKGKKALSVSDLLNEMDKRQSYSYVNGKMFIRLWAVADTDKGFKVIADGFTCKADAKAYCDNCSFNWYLFPYEKNTKDSYTK